MNRRRITLYQVLGWALLIGYDLFFTSLNFSPSSKIGLDKLLLLQFTFWLATASLFYYCYLFVFPQGLRPGRWPVLGLGLLGAPLVFAASRYLLQEVGLPFFFGFRNYFPGTSLLYYLKDNAYFIPPTVVLAGAAVLVRDAFVREKDRESQLQLQAAEQARTQAELAFLRTQLNPHFLYNTLNYLYATAYEVSEELAEAIMRLSDLIRYQLHDSPDGRVDLAKEVEYVENYLALHRLRFEDKFFVEFTQTGQPVGGQRLAPLLLIPFVENALKHGVVSQAAHPVRIHLHLSPANLLELTVENCINQQQKDTTTGVGLPNIRRRLALLYPARHILTVTNAGSTYHTHLAVHL